jgi:Flp pilus assembly protein TadD
VKQKVSIYSIVAVSVIWLTSCSEKTEFVSSQSQSNWKNADPAGLAAAEPEPMPDIMPQTHYAAGRLFEKQGAPARAAKQYKKALLRDPDHVPSLSRLGMIYAQQGHYPQAEEYLQKAVELWPNSPQARNNLGFCYVMQERWYDAEAEFRNTLKLDPSFVRARVNLAMALSKLNRFDDALGEFKLAVPEPEAYYNLGLLYRSAQRYEEAAGAFATALKREPKMTLAKQQLDRMKLQMERTREYPIDTPTPQSTEFAASNQPQHAPASNVRANQSYAMQPVEPQSTRAAGLQPVVSSETFATPEQNAQTAAWSNPSTASPSNTQPVESAQYSNSQYADEPVATSPAVLPMRPVEASVAQSDSQHQDTSPAVAQDDVSTRENLTASNSTQNQQVQESSIVPAAETYETYPVVSTVESAEDETQETSESATIEMASTEPVESNEPTQQEEASSEETEQWDRSRFVGNQSSNEPQEETDTEVLQVQPVFIAADQTESNEPQSQAPTQLKPIVRPIQTQNVAATQPVTAQQKQTRPATSTQVQNPDTLVLEVTPVEESYAPNRKPRREYQRVETQQRSASTMSPAEPQNNAPMTADVSEIESIESVEPTTVVAPKKARTATHKSNSDQVEVKTMDKVGMAPVAPAPQPRMQVLPESSPAKSAAPQKAIKPAVLEMTPIEVAAGNKADDSDSAKNEEDVEVVEMEAVED